MGAFFSSIIAKIVGISEWIGRLFVAVFVAAWDFIRDAVCWPFEQLLTLVQTALAAIDVSGVSGQIGVWGSIPGDVLNILGLLGVGTAIAIITSAIGVRLALQLIPFVRLGS